MNMVPMQRGAELFPYDIYYRLGPAQLMIHDNVWYRPSQGLAILDSVLKNDPHSHYLQAWRGEFQRRLRVMGQ